MWKILAPLLVTALLAAACGEGDGAEGGSEPAEVEAGAGQEGDGEVRGTGDQESSGPGADSDPVGGAGGEGPVPGELEFRAAVLAGGDLDGSSLAGRDVVFWFWAPWCTVCRAEAPTVAAAAETFAGEVELIGIAGRGEVSEMERFVDDTGTDGFSHLVDDTGDLWARFGVVQQPAFAFIDDSGSVEVVGGRLSEDELAERLQTLSAT